MVKKIKPLLDSNNAQPKKEVEVFSAASKRLGVNEYRYALNLPESLKCLDAGNKFTAKVQADFHSTVAINGQSLKDIATKEPNKATHITAIDAAMKVCITQSEGTRNILESYKDHITAINQLLKNDQELNYNVFQVINGLHTLRSNTLAKLKEQQKKEIIDLEAKFGDQGFKNHIAQAYNIDENKQAEIDPVKKEYVQALEKKHAEQNKAFNDSVESDLTKIHKESQKEVDRISFLASMYYSNKKSREALDKLKAKHPGKPHTELIAGQGEVDINDNWATFRGIKPEDVTELQSLNVANRLTRSKKSITRAADGSFSMKIPTDGWQVDLYVTKLDVFGYSGSKIKTDMLALAEAVRASGFDTINFNINHKIREAPNEAKEFDEQRLNLLARNAYAAGLQAGFKSEDITANLNGKTYKGAELRGLFAGHEAELKMADDMAQQTQDVYDDIKEQHKEVTTKERKDFYEGTKKFLEEGRNAARKSPLKDNENLLDPNFTP